MRRTLLPAHGFVGVIGVRLKGDGCAAMTTTADGIARVQFEDEVAKLISIDDVGVAFTNLTLVAQNLEGQECATNAAVKRQRRSERVGNP